MAVEPRPYRNEDDLETMRAILIEGRKAANGTYYVHVGDLNWWLFYGSLVKEDRREIIWLWEDETCVIGWSLFSPAWRAFDVFVHPSERGSERARQICAWSADRMAEMVRQHGGSDVMTMWIAEEDLEVKRHLEHLGFQLRSSGMAHLTRRLTDERLPDPVVLPGYVVRSVRDERDGELRAAAAYGAFGSHLPFEEYWPRYRSFMQSPVYNADLDVIVMAPDGRCASFCVCWIDEVNCVGLFEPVGTHPDFWRQGLGKVVMREGLKRMQARGMTSAMVCTDDDNASAIGLYESVGFRITNRLRTYAKAV